MANDMDKPDISLNRDSEVVKEVALSNEIILNENFKDGPVKDLLKLMENPDFREDFINVHTQEELDTLKLLDSGLENEVKVEINNIIQEEVVRILAEEKGIPGLTNEDAKRLPEFGRNMGMLRSRGINGVSVNDLYQQRLEIRKTSEDYINARNQAQEVLEKAREEKLNQLRQVYADLVERAEDPDLVDAFSFWGNSPDSKNNRGLDGKGFNAGLIHYFEYRANVEKNGRYKNETSNFGVDGFIEFSNRVKNVVDTANKENSRLFKDSQGQLRMYTLSDQGEMVISFKRVEEDNLKIVTVIPGQNMDTLGKSVDNSEEKYLNKLGEGKEEISL